MSLDLLKSALYQAIKTDQPTLAVYPDLVLFEAETFPNLSFVDVATENLKIKPFQEYVTIPSGAPAPAAPLLTFPVIARKRTRLRLQLRDDLGGTPTAEAYQLFCERHNALDRFFSKLRRITVSGPNGADTLADLEYLSDRQRHDATAGLCLSEFELDLNPWRLLDTGPGLATFRADSLALDVKRTDDQLLIAHLIPPTLTP